MSQDVQSQLSLLSLSIAAASATPIPASNVAGDAANKTVQGATTNTTTHTKHRRLSSAGRSRRRLSDARDAATRPFVTSASLQTASASLAALSLASPVEETTRSDSPPRTLLASNPVNISANLTKSGRKRGTIFTCESCSKVYRHPSCLIKHRWEHTPQWREASKFVLSKHQQVQLLEAAAILAHLSPSSASLPEDRSLWPSFLSGGLVPPPASVPNSDLGPTMIPTTTTGASSIHTFPVSSSVPASTSTVLSTPTAPRLHDYAIGEDSIGLTQVRPGMLAMNGDSRRVDVTGSVSVSVPVPVPAGTREDDALNLLALHSSGYDTGTPGSWGPTSISSPRLTHTRSHSYSVSHSRSAMAPSHAHAQSLSLSQGRMAPGWSLPRSSVRFRSKSKSGSERSRSASQSVSASEDRSDDEDQAQDHAHEVGVADIEEDEGEAYGTWKRRGGAMREEDEGEGDKGVRVWDGMEMEMEME